jgi:hypothetical protein
MRPTSLSCLILAALIAIASAPPGLAQETAPTGQAPTPQVPSEITGNRRLMERFVEDGAMVRQGWMEARAGYASWGDGHDLSVGTLMAFRVFENFELGGRLGYMDRSRSKGEILLGERLPNAIQENGLTDLDLFAKFRVQRSPLETSLGLLVKLPVADDAERLGSGGTDYELFLGTRRTLQRLAWVGNAGVRFNGDSRAPGAAGGRTSILLGGGAVVAVAYAWTFLAEAAFETRRYAGGDPDLRLVPAIEYRPTENLSFRLGASVGLADGSPDQEMTLAAVFQF